MPTQYLEDPETKEQIPFEWDKPTPPTSDDINSLFSAVKESRKGETTGKPSGFLGDVYEEVKGMGRALTKPRTYYQMLGATAGGMVGGPGGGAVGYAMGEKAADIFVGDRPVSKDWLGLKQSGQDIGMGLLYELLGAGAMIGGRVISGAVDLASAINKYGIKGAIDEALSSLSRKQASKIIARATTTEPGVTSQIAKNVEQAEQIEKEIPGLRFNLGQRGGDPNLISTERQVGQMPGPGTALSQERVMSQDQAILDYIQTRIRGGGKVEDFVSSVKSEQERLAGVSGKAQTGVEKEAEKVKGESVLDVGKYLRDKATDVKTKLSQKAKELYDAVPENLKINSRPLWDKIEEMFGSYDAFTQRLSATPTGPMGRVRGLLTPEEAGIDPNMMTMKQAKDFRSQMETTQRTAISSGDFELAFKCGLLRDGVNDTLDLAVKEGSGPAIRKLQKATDFWRDTYVPTIRQGTTGKILAKERTGAYRVIDSSVGSEYFKAGKGEAEAANDFFRIYGSDAGAKQAIKDYAAQSLLRSSRNPVTKELESNRIMAWLNKHEIVLDRFGLKDSFRNIQKSSEVADAARMEEAQFNKSAVAKALGADPEKVIPTVLAPGGSQTIVRFGQMVTVARKGGESAVEGLKAGVADYFRTQMKLTARDLAGNNLDSLAKIDKFMTNVTPVLKSSGLYKEAEIKAFDNVHQTLQIISRQNRPHPQFQGSPTFELLSRLAASGTSMAFGHIGMYGAAKGVFDLMEKPIRNQIQESVARAIFDPRYAEAISGLSIDLSKTTVEIAEQRFIKRLFSLGAMTMSSQNQ